MILRRLVIFSIVAFAFAHAFAGLSDVDRALDRRARYIDMRQHRIDSLRALMATSGSSDILMNLADAYTGFNNDSALAILARGMEFPDARMRMPFVWKHAALLPLAGFFEQAEKEFGSISPDSVPEELKPSYFDAGRQMHSYTAAFMSGYPLLSMREQGLADVMQDSLLSVLSPMSVDYHFNLAESYFYRGERRKAELLLDEIVMREPASSHFRARAAHHLSTIARERGDENAYLRYLCISAVADIMSATREVASLQELGAYLNESGDVSRAYRYLSTALANAVECGAPLRMVESAKALPIIERAHTAKIDDWRRTVYWIIACMAVLMLVLVGVLLLLRNEMHAMKVLQGKLRTANNAKEVYISQFLQLCSIYMDKLTKFCKITERKIASGQADELLRMVRSGRFVEEQSGEFYELFDDAFLHIYPDFVQEVNALLRPDAQIALKKGEKLNTDLRILAFMRLGIEESARIAQILNYSLNTVYAYRNRLKGKAIDRDNFEKSVIKIDGY